MPQNQPGKSLVFFRMMQKFFLSVIVIGSFIVYALHERLMNPVQTDGDPSSTKVALDTGPSATETQLVPTPTLTSPTATAIPPTATHTPTLATPTLVIVNQAPSTATRSLPTSTPIPPTLTPVPPTITPVPPTVTPTGRYRDGQYTGNIANAFYGLVQVKTVITGGKITNVLFLQYPNDRRTSQLINAQAMPYLKTEAIRAQSAQVDLVSGATLTSEAFVQSLQTALNKAKG